MEKNKINERIPIGQRGVRTERGKSDREMIKSCQTVPRRKKKKKDLVLAKEKKEKSDSLGKEDKG